MGSDAKFVFGQALKVDAVDVRVRYYLGRACIAEGEVAAGLSDWRGLLASLAPNAPGRESLAAEIAEVEASGKLPGPQPAAESANPEVQGMIAGMVDGLAQRLKQSPDDPDGWVRLVRAYAVLGETAKRDAALVTASALFKDQLKVMLVLCQVVDMSAQAKMMNL